MLLLPMYDFGKRTFRNFYRDPCLLMSYNCLVPTCRPPRTWEASPSCSSSSTSRSFNSDIYFSESRFEHISRIECQKTRRNSYSTQHAVNNICFSIYFLNMSQSRPLIVYFRPFLNAITIKNWKSIDGVLGIQTWGRRMVGTDETMELWRPIL